jgi:ABC-type glutathione transport system ATPase component
VGERAASTNPTQRAALDENSRPVIHVGDLVKVYGLASGAVTALRGVSLAVRRGEFV